MYKCTETEPHQTPTLRLHELPVISARGCGRERRRTGRRLGVAHHTPNRTPFVPRALMREALFKGPAVTQNPPAGKQNQGG